MKIILKGSNDIYLYGDLFQNKWKSTKFSRKPMSSKMDQEDEKRCPRCPRTYSKQEILKETPWMEVRKLEAPCYLRKPSKCPPKKILNTPIECPRNSKTTLSLMKIQEKPSLMLKMKLL